MKTNLEHKIKAIPVNKIKTFISRDRDPGVKEKLKNSIKENGLIMPITVIAKSNGSYQLIKGEGRTLAHKQLHIPKIKAFVFKEGEMKEKDIIQNWLVENEVREKMSEVDRARLMRAEYEIEGSIESIAKKYKLKPATAKQYIKTMEDTSDKVIQLVDNKKITFTKAKEIGAATKNKATQEVIAQVIAEDHLSHQDARIMIKKAQDIEKSKSKVTINELRASLKSLKDDVRRIKNVVAALRKRYVTMFDAVNTLINNIQFIEVLKKNDIVISNDIEKLIKGVQ